jgi:nucleoside-diphosphate-sugar epimerase
LPPGRVFNEDDWANLDNLTAYEKSKTLAEHAAWDYVSTLSEDQKFELATINPGLVLGPILTEDHGTSNEVIRKMMCRELPGLPNLGFMVVDVRDVAHAHILAMTAPGAVGKRFVCASEFVSIYEIARILDEYVRPKGFRIPQRKLPDIVVKLVALFDKTTRLVVHSLGERREASNARIKEVLGWQPRNLQETLTATADSLIEHGVVSAR